MPDKPIIIYIEDNLDNQRLVQRILNAKNYTVLLADDGPSGLALAREAQPVLVLVDLNIPGLDGYETTTRLRSLGHLRDTPIIALTADTTPGARDRALVAGCDGYLSKPIDARRLPVQIAEFMAGKRELVSSTIETDVLREYNQKLVERLEQRVRELSSANIELQELDRIKSQFLATLSHELRTPMTSLLGYLELFNRNLLGPLSDAQREAIVVMRRSADTLNRHLNNLLYLQEARSTALVLTKACLHEILTPLITDMQQKATQRSVHIDLAIAEVAPLLVDKAAIELAMRNVLDNAVKFTPADGHVEVQLQDEPSRVLLCVADTGCGIPEEFLEKIFLPFYQIDNSLARPYPGNGLGLAIARHIIEAHGGQITVRSILNQGSVFTLMLPRHES